MNKALCAASYSTRVRNTHPQSAVVHCDAWKGIKRPVSDVNNSCLTVFIQLEWDCDICSRRDNINYPRVNRRHLHSAELWRHVAIDPLVAQNLFRNRMPWPLWTRLTWRDTMHTAAYAVVRCLSAYLSDSDVTWRRNCHNQSADVNEARVLPKN